MEFVLFVIVVLFLVMVCTGFRAATLEAAEKEAQWWEKLD